MASGRTYHNYISIIKQFEVSDTKKSAVTYLGMSMYLVRGCVWFQGTKELNVVQDVQLPVEDSQLRGSGNACMQAGGPRVALAISLVNQRNGEIKKNVMRKADPRGKCQIAGFEK